MLEGRIAEISSSERIQIAVGNVGGTRESMRYADQFLALIDSLNMADGRQNQKDVNGGRSLGLVSSSNPEGKGIYVSVANRLKPPPEGIGLKSILSKCGITATFDDFQGMLPKEVWIIVDRAD